MRCCIVRHGETPWNAERRLQGHQDIPLNALGVHQAQAAARHLATCHLASPFHAVVSSDLQRAWQTAAAIGQLLSLPVQEEPALRERHYGDFEGKTPDEARLFNAAAYESLVSRDSLSTEPGRAESLDSMVNRLESCLRQLVEKHPEQSIILVTHGGVLDILYRRAMGRALTGPRDRPIPNAGLNWLELTVAGEQLCWAMLSWGETTHLEDASRDEIL